MTASSTARGEDGYAPYARFAGRRAVVTGAASGIGEATAIRLAAEGAHVVLTDISPRVKGVESCILERGGSATAVKADVADEASWREVVAAADGALDVLVSNAFVVDVQEAAALSLASWERQMAVNLTGAFLAVRSCLPGLRQSQMPGGGSVLLVSSVHAQMGLVGHPAYAAAKGALTSLARQLAVEYGPSIRVNSVLPGPVMTRAWDRVSSEDQAASAAATALGRLGTPSEVAAAIAFLTSPEASFVTGASLVVDGGWTVAKDSA